MKAYAKLSDASKWTQGAMARDKIGERCDTFDPDAVRWCVLGAMRECYIPNSGRDMDDEGMYHPPYVAAKKRLNDHLITLGHPYIIYWQDDAFREFDEVRSALIAADV